MRESDPILILSSEPEIRGRLAELICNYGLQAICCDGLAAARTLLAHEPFSAIVCEDRFSDGAFRDLGMKRAKRASRLPVIVASRRDDWDTYLRVIGSGASEWVALPPGPGELEHALWRVLDESRRLNAVTSRWAA